MQEHICEELRYVETRGGEIVQRTPLRKLGVKNRYHSHCTPKEHIEYQQILGDRRHVLKETL